MGNKMSEGTRVVVVNAAIIAGLILCYVREYPLEIVLVSGLFLLAFANILMYFKRKRVQQSRPLTEEPIQQKHASRSNKH
jgi:hypothetical protein